MRIVVGFKMFAYRFENATNHQTFTFEPNNIEPSSVELIKWENCRAHPTLTRLQAARWPPKPRSSEREREGEFFMVIKIYQMEWWAARSQIAFLWTTIKYVWIRIVCNEFGFNINFKSGAPCFIFLFIFYSFHQFFYS